MQVLFISILIFRTHQQHYLFELDDLLCLNGMKKGTLVKSAAKTTVTPMQNANENKFPKIVECSYIPEFRMY